MRSDVGHVIAPSGISRLVKRVTRPWLGTAILFAVAIPGIAACAPPPAPVEKSPASPEGGSSPAASRDVPAPTPTLVPALTSPTQLPSQTPLPIAASPTATSLASSPRPSPSPTRSGVAQSPTSVAPASPGEARTATIAARITATARARPTPTSIAQESAGPTPTPTQRQTADRPDDHDGYQVHFLYVLPSDGHDEGLDTKGWIATAVDSAQRWLEKETGGRRLSVDTFGGALDITFVRLSRPDAVVSAYDSRTATSREPLVRLTLEVELRSRGFDDPRKVYGVYYGGGSDTGECFGGSYPPGRPGNLGIANVKLGGRCEEIRMMVHPDGTHEITMGQFHEIFHTLGAVARCAPHHNAETSGHVSDDPQDMMFPRSSRTLPRHVDAGRDDYFGHGKPDCLDLARSPFLSPAPANPELPPLWPMAAARPRDCSEEATLGAASSGAQAGIIFDNMRGTTAQVFQVTPEGRTPRDTVRPWTASYQRGAQEGSAWLIADEAGKCLAIYVAEATWTRASVR